DEAPAPPHPAIEPLLFDRLEARHQVGKRDGHEGGRDQQEEDEGGQGIGIPGDSLFALGHRSLPVARPTPARPAQLYFTRGAWWQPVQNGSSSSSGSTEVKDGFLSITRRSPKESRRSSKVIDRYLRKWRRRSIKSARSILSRARTPSTARQSSSRSTRPWHG